jgi:glycosyltransferase involved in cell wall biosynthesis
VWQDLRATVQVARALRRVRPDIVHTHNPKPGIIGRVIARCLRVPLVVNTQHGLYAQPGDRRRRRWPVYAVERVAAAFSHVELVQNEEDVHTLVDVLRVPARRVRLLGNGIDLARFDPATVDPGVRRSVRAGWGVADDEVLIGTVGRLVREKGIAELLDVAHRLRTEGVTARLVVIGPRDGDKGDAVDEATIARAEADGVVFAGRRDDMPACYAALDLYVTASWREGFPRAAMEASAMGLATVATDVRGNRQVVADGVTGTLVPVRDAVGLTRACRALVDEPSRRQRLGAAARDRALREFGQQTVIDRTLAVYAQIDRGRVSDDRGAAAGG